MMKGGDILPRPKTKTATQSKNEYSKRTYDDIRLQVKKGKKELIRAYALSKGLSLQGFINSLIVQEMGDSLTVPGEAREPEGGE